MVAAVPVQQSPPILVAAATPTDFLMQGQPRQFALGVVFFSTALAGPADAIAAGSGTRDLAISQIVELPDRSRIELAFAGGTLDTPTVAGGAVTALPARALVTFDAGVNSGLVRVVSAGVVSPAGAVTYRIVVIW